MGEELTLDIASKSILHWNCRGFEQLPEELRNGEEVKEIYLKWNNLICLQSWVGKLRSLTNLYLQHNQLKSLPEELRELSQLRVLDVSHNRLQSLPSGIGNLVGLTQLLVADNDIFCLPKEFQKLQSLKLLDLCGNKFRNIPQPVLECHNLEEILLDNNQLTSLPDNIVYLLHLETLSVCGNNLLYLPYQPFSSNPSLYFQNNQNLNHISIWLGQQIDSKNGNNFHDNSSWNLSGAQGCFQTNQFCGCSQRGTLLVGNETSGNGVPLILPSSLKYISSGKCCEPTVPPLQELSLRIVYSLGYHHTINVKRNGEGTITTMTRTATNNQLHQCLPLILQCRLKVGPVAVCYYPPCQKPIFTYGVIWVILKDYRYENYSSPPIFYVLSTVVFCSVNCSLSHNEWETKKEILDTLEKHKLNWFCKK